MGPLKGSPIIFILRLRRIIGLLAEFAAAAAAGGLAAAVWSVVVSVPPS